MEPETQLGQGNYLHDFIWSSLVAHQQPDHFNGLLALSGSTTRAVINRRRVIRICNTQEETSPDFGALVDNLSVTCNVPQIAK